MDLKELCINRTNWVDSAQESPCECGIEPPGFISHGVGVITGMCVLCRLVDSSNATFQIQIRANVLKKMTK